MKGSGVEIASRPGCDACVELSPKLSRTLMLPNVCSILVTPYFSLPLASHTSTPGGPSGVFARPQQTATTSAAERLADPPSLRRRTAEQMRTRFAEPQNRPASSRPNCGGTVGGTISIPGYGISSVSSTISPRTLVFGSVGKAVL